MSNALEQHLKECKAMNLAAIIWLLILWHATDEGKIEISLEHKLLSSELVRAIWKEVVGVEIGLSGEDGLGDFGWERQLNEALDACEHNVPDAFDETNLKGKMRALLKRFVLYKFQSENNEKDWVSELKLFSRDHIPRAMSQRTFKVEARMRDKAVDELLRYTFSHHSEVCNWCRTIGTIMRPYIEYDVARIKLRNS